MGFLRAGGGDKCELTPCLLRDDLVQGQEGRGSRGT